MWYEAVALRLLLALRGRRARGVRLKVKPVKLEPPVGAGVGVREPPSSVYGEAGVVLGDALYLAPAWMAPRGGRAPTVRSVYLSSRELASLSESVEKMLERALTGGEGEG